MVFDGMSAKGCSSNLVRRVYVASILATPIRQCLYTRKILPSGKYPDTASKICAETEKMAHTASFLTKLIQAAPDSPGDRVWIVPEQIIPYELSKETNSGQALDRFGMGKWMFSGSNLVQSMVKEGKYKMINSSAYVRPDLAQLIYAQWTMRVVHNTLDMCKRATGNPPFVILTKEPSAIATTPDAKPEVLQRLTDETHHNAYLQCVLRFESDTDVATSFGNSEPQEPSVDLIPNLPSFSDRSLVQEDVKILRKGGKTTVVPMYNMKYLLGNHPQGLRAVHQAFLKRIPAAEGSAEDSNQRWIGLVESPQTVDTAVGLWKLASMMPRQSK
ncbi:hypothetical protein BGZ54_008848 [Gamsiella multidivaricata]|nr:hypothetical protein BGZ54_008848 [Gamsiella multidivaricata]